MRHLAHAVATAMVVCLAAFPLLAQPSCPTPQIVQTGGPNPTCAGVPVTLDAGAGWTSYQWSNGVTTRLMTDSPASTTAYTVTTTDANGCSATSQPYQVVVVAAPDAPAISLSSTSICAGSTLSASDTSSTAWATRQWSATNATVVDHGDSAEVHPDGSGDVVVTLSATDANGCPASASATATLRTIPPPTLYVSNPSVCPDSYAAASINPPADANTSWRDVQWHVDYGTITYSDNYSVFFMTDPGGQPAKVTAVATDTLGCTNSATYNFSVRSIPPPTLYVSNPNVCPGSYAAASINPPADSNTSWRDVQWHVDYGTITYSDNYSVFFMTDPGGQPAKVTAVATDTLGCTNSTTYNFSVRSIPPPTLYVSNPNVCPSSYAAASINPPADSNTSWRDVQWHVDNGTITFSDNYSVYFMTDPGGQPAKVTAVATDTLGCTNSTTYNFSVRTIPPPTLYVSNPNVCPGSYAAASINPPADANTTWRDVQWHVDNGTITFSDNYSVYFTTDPSGLPAKVTAVATDTLGCTNSTTYDFGVRIIPPPTLYVYNSNICPGSYGAASINPPADSMTQWRDVHWTVDHGTITFSDNYSVYFTTDPSGLPAKVTAVATDTLGCTSSTSYDFGVRNVAPPVIAIQPSFESVCPGSPVEASIQPPADTTTQWQTIQWSVANGTLLDQGGTFVHFTSDPDAQPAALTVTATDTVGCTATATKNFGVATPPDFTVTADRPTLCANATAQVHAGSSATLDRFAWTVAHGTISGPTDTADAAVIADGTGDVQLTVTAFANGVCAVRATLTLPLAAPPDATITAPASACGSFTASVVDAGPGATYSWSATGATLTSASGPSAAFTVSGSGTIDLSVTINANGCASSGTKSLSAGTPPAAAITASGPTTFCAGSSVTLTASAGASYAWSNGATTQSIAVSSSGSYSVVVTNASGCSATSAPAAVTVNANPPAPAVSASGPTALCPGGSVTLTAPAGYAYAWSNGASTQSITVSAAGNYSVVVTNASGCSAASSAVAVTALPAPATPAITAGGATTICDGQSVTLTSSAAASYLWSNGATTRAITATAGGNYTVTTTDANGCSATSQPVTVTVGVPKPAVEVLSPTDICPGTSASLHVATPAGVTSMTVVWSNGANGAYLYPSEAGSYTATVTFPGGCQQTTDPVVVTVKTPGPAAAIQPDLDFYCAAVEHTATAAGGPFPSYRWSVLGATVVGPTDQATVHFIPNNLVAGAGVDFGLWVGDPAGSGCETYSSWRTAEGPLPVQSIYTSQSPSLCYGNDVRASINGHRGSTYRWTIQNGTISSDPTQPFIDFVAGTSGSTTLSVTETSADGCTATSTKTIPIAADLTWDFTINSGCPGGPASAYFNPSWNGGPYTWSVTNATITSGQGTRSIEFTANGSAPVDVTLVLGTSCTSTRTHREDFFVLPPPTFSDAPAKVCAGSGSGMFVDRTLYDSIDWSIQGGTINSSSNVGIGFTAGPSGNVVITAVGHYGTCPTATTTITIPISDPNPPPLVVTPATSCPAGTFTVAAPTGYRIASLSATRATILAANSSGYSLQASGGGSVDITYALVNPDGCVTNQTTQSVPVTYTTAPAISLGLPANFCTGMTGTASVSNGPYATYSWSITGGAISGSAANSSVAFIPDGSGVVYLTVNVTDGRPGCGTYTTQYVPMANVHPSISASGPTTFCPPSTVTLTSSAANSYLWSTGATTQAITVNTTGDYSVTTTTNGCSFTSSPVHVEVRLEATVSASKTQACQGDTVTLTANVTHSSGNVTVTWYRWGVGPLPNGQAASVGVQSSGTYYAVIHDNVYGCTITSNNLVVNVSSPYAAIFVSGGPPSFCAGGSRTLTATSGLAGYLWSTGATTDSIVVSASGNYTVTVTDAAGCSYTTPPTAITVNAPPPAPAIAPSGPTTFCSGGSVTLTAPAGYTYAWSTGATTQSIAVSSAGSYSVNVTDANGCSAASAPVAVSVNPNPPTPAITPSGPTSFCSGGSVTLTAPAGYTYAWSTGATTQSIAVSSSGNYSVTVTDANGCSRSSAATAVTVNPLPAPTITAGGPTTFCAGGSVTLTASSASSYLWSTGATTQSIAVNAAGSYSVTVTNANGCSATSAATSVTVNPLPTPTITAGGPTTFCAGGSVTLTASSGSSYAWSTGATTQSIAVNASGSYSVRVTDANGCSATSAATTVTVNTPATPTISGPTTFCAGGSVTLTASSASSYLWSTGATTRSIAVNASGSYSVTVTDANGCSATSAATAVTVNSVPTPSITAGGPTTFCAGGSVTLTAPSGNYIYSWGPIGANTQSINVTSSGSYTVTIVDPNTGCSATSAPVDVTVRPPLTPSISNQGPTTFCAGGSVLLSTGTWSSYRWSNGATTQSISATSSGSYNVTVTDANGCSATTATITVTVNPAPPAPAITAGGPTTFCAGGSVTLTASSASSYLWSNGATTQSIAVNASGSYSVTVTDANGCSATSSATSVTVNPLPAPTITAGGATTFCAGGSVTLTASSASSYLWSNGATTQSITANASGSYSVTVTNANGCSATSSATSVTVNPLPTPTITAGGPTTICAGGSVTLTASSASSYLWSNGATTQSIAANASGSYSVTVTDANGCSATSSATSVTVNALPTPSITAGGDTRFCAGGNVTLTASAASSYLWSTGATAQSITVYASGDYTVTVTDANGCSATSAATTVTFNPLPAAPSISAGGSTAFCAGGSVTLTSSSTANNQWYRDGVAIATAAGNTYSATASGNYTVTVTDSHGCTSVASQGVAVTVYSPPATPTISYTGSTSFCDGGSVLLTSSSASGYQWYRDGISIANATSNTYSAATSGNYTVIVTDGHGCASLPSPIVSVAVNPNPAAPSITAGGNTAFCAGGSVTLTSSSVSGNQWYRDNVAIANATGSTYSATASGSYTVTFTDPRSCTSVPSQGVAVTVYSPPATPTIGASGQTTFCSGGSVVLTSSSASGNQWYRDGIAIATTQSINVTTAGNYKVTVTDAHGCSATSAETPVIVNPLPPTPTITAGGATTFCNGSSVTLTAPAGYTYAWSNGATTQSIAATASGSYSVTVRDANGCSATSAATSVTVNPTITAFGPLTQSVAKNGTPQTLTVTATGPTLKYQWYKGPSGNTSQKVGSTTNTFKPPTNATGTFTYWVRVTSGTCTADTPVATVTVN